MILSVSMVLHSSQLIIALLHRKYFLAGYKW